MVVAQCVDFVVSYRDFFAFNLREELDADHVCQGLQFCVADKTVPRGVHVAFAGDPSRMAVSWLTYGTGFLLSLLLGKPADTTLPVPTNTSMVQWSLTPGGPIIGTAHGLQTSYLST